MNIAIRIVKKGGQYLGILGIVFLVSACGSQTPMDKQAEDGKYHYKNSGLGFELDLPSSFKKYQSQRKKGEGFTEIQILVPTGDKDKFGKVYGYARPVTIRVYDSPRDDYGNFRKITSGKKEVYTINFWQKNQIPDDWKEKWNDQVKNNIRESFRLNSD